MNNVYVSPQIADDLVRLLDIRDIDYTRNGDLFRIDGSPEALKLLRIVIAHDDILECDGRCEDFFTLYVPDEFLCNCYYLGINRYVAYHFSRPYVNEFARLVAIDVVWRNHKPYSVFPYSDLRLLSLINDL